MLSTPLTTDQCSPSLPVYWDLRDGSTELLEGEAVLENLELGVLEGIGVETLRYFPLPFRRDSTMRLASSRLSLHHRVRHFRSLLAGCPPPVTLLAPLCNPRISVPFHPPSFLVRATPPASSARPATGPA